MIRRIYHGSKDVIEKPKFGYGKRYNDYGLGFYCTDSIEMAKDSNQYCILHWLAVLLENREFDVPSGLALEAKEYILNNFLISYSAADIMIGYRADDSYFSFAQDFINGTISYRQLNNAMHLGKLGQQIVLKSKEAFNRIHYVGNEVALYSEWYAKKQLRDKTARREYFNTERNKRQRGDLYITMILDEEMKPHDPRLR